MANDVTPTRHRRRTWVIAVLAAWAVVLGVAAYASSRSGAPTAREQTSVADARPITDRAVTAIVGVGASSDAIVSVSPFTRLGRCRISVIRDGERWEQSITLFTPPGGENALLNALAARMPAGYRATVRVRGGQRTLRADAGDFVGISGGVAEPGEVRVTVATGCRSSDGAPTRVVTTAEPPAGARDPVDAALAALKLRPARWSAFEIPCPDGRAVRVVTAEGEPGVVPVPLPSALGPLGPAPVVAEPDRYAYRTGNTSVVARLGDAGLSIISTSGCA